MAKIKEYLILLVKYEVYTFMNSKMNFNSTVI